MNGQEILDTRDLKRSHDLFRHMGELLSTQIHSYSHTGDHGGLRSADFKALRFDVDYVPKVFVEESQALLEQIDAPVHEWTLTHGDFGSHNILADGRKLTVIDWEWAEWGHPLVDIAWACWNTKLHYPKIADGLNHTFIRAYQARRPISCTSEHIKAYSLYKLWTILQKVKHADRQTQMKWVNRLEWTLHTDILRFNQNGYIIRFSG
jgi:aminoglycoside phosphotransferase (APT) family kinase protein